jgi:hypothetical protein
VAHGAPDFPQPGKIGAAAQTERALQEAVTRDQLN